ncbi:hypothetical protein K469DRAFT_686219 [Zopfia rhizophila CBS 207.26]|uniref:Uncharacterized protein n=1 Tax=Zopfia rhizophila CBS 207.26 TaxID=1314779 RepID=A0A6A6E754_9PEZI|nr:hypothetical protein K469DRAFT_686219 [Zopfia rhizophila CBS 207.26]
MTARMHIRTTYLFHQCCFCGKTTPGSAVTTYSAFSGEGVGRLFAGSSVAGQQFGLIRSNDKVLEGWNTGMLWGDKGEALGFRFMVIVPPMSRFQPEQIKRGNAAMHYEWDLSFYSWSLPYRPHTMQRPCHLAALIDVVESGGLSHGCSGRTESRTQCLKDVDRERVSEAACNIERMEVVVS